VNKGVKEVAGVVWACGRFWVVLHRENRLILNGDASYCLVIEVLMRHFDIRIGCDTFFRNYEAVVLSSDFTFARLEIQNGMVDSTVTVEHFNRLKTLAKA